MPGTLVSDHPEGRLGARGKLAHELVANPPWDDYYGPGSALERLCQMGGKVLRLGADLGTVTLLHYAEYLAPIARKRRVRRYRRVVGPAGTSIRTVDCLDDRDGIAHYPLEGDYFAVLLTDYLKTGRALGGVVGHARSELIDAADLVRFGVTWMAENLQPF
jgi:aminoglycoside 3-N-acetyltransferase